MQADQLFQPWHHLSAVDSESRATTWPNPSNTPPPNFPLTFKWLGTRSRSVRQKFLCAPAYAWRLPYAPSSRAVLALWHRLFIACQLFLSQNLARSPRCGSMWSTTLAGSLRSRRSQSEHSQKRCLARNATLALRQAWPYNLPADDGRLASDSRFAACLCCGHLPDPSATNWRQPGCVHGLGAERGMS